MGRAKQRYSRHPRERRHQGREDVRESEPTFPYGYCSTNSMTGTRQPLTGSAPGLRICLRSNGAGVGSPGQSMRDTSTALSRIRGSERRGHWRWSPRPPVRRLHRGEAEGRVRGHRFLPRSRFIENAEVTGKIPCANRPRRARIRRRLRAAQLARGLGGPTDETNRDDVRQIRQNRVERPPT